MNEFFGLSYNTIAQIINVLSDFPEVEEAIIYGSRAKGNYKNGSDIDLTLKGDKLNYELLLKIMNKIDDLLLPYSVDISIFNEIDDESLIEHIIRVGKIIYSRSSAEKDLN